MSEAAEWLDHIKDIDARHFEEKRKWEALCERAVRGDVAELFWHAPDRDYRIRLVAEPMP